MEKSNYDTDLIESLYNIHDTFGSEITCTYSMKFRSVWYFGENTDFGGTKSRFGAFKYSLTITQTWEYKLIVQRGGSCES